VNLAVATCNHVGDFYLTCFVRVCEIFTAVVKASRTWSHVVLYVRMPQHIYAVCLLFGPQIKKTDVKLIKKVGHALCQIF